MSTYMELCNKVLRRHNETPFTSSTFPSPRGYHAAVQEFVNSAVREINQAEFEWPFNHSIGTQVLTAGTTTYDLPSDAKSVDWQSFYIQADDSLDPVQEAKKLSYLDYDQYMSGRLAQDLQHINDSSYDNFVPDYVFRNQALEFGVTPVPGQAFTIKFEYWGYPDSLSAYNDECTIPERFDHVIVDGALFYAYMLRENWDAAGLSKRKFDEGIKQMRTMLINRYDTVYDTRGVMVVGGYW